MGGPCRRGVLPRCDLTRRDELVAAKEITDGRVMVGAHDQRAGV